MIKIQSNKPDELVFICSNEDEKEFIKNNSEKILDEFVQAKTNNHWKSFKDYLHDMVFVNEESDEIGLSLKTCIRANHYLSRNMYWSKSNIESLEYYANQAYLHREKNK